MACKLVRLYSGVRGLLRRVAPGTEETIGFLKEVGGRVVGQNGRWRLTGCATATAYCGRSSIPSGTAMRNDESQPPHIENRYSHSVSSTVIGQWHSRWRLPEVARPFAAGLNIIAAMRRHNDSELPFPPLTRDSKVNKDLAQGMTPKSSFRMPKTISCQWLNVTDKRLP